MSTIYSFAHISDIHLAPLPQPHWQELIGKRITGYLNWKKHRKNELDSGTLPALMQDLHNRAHEHLLISGDLVNLSLDSEFEKAYDWLIKQGTPQDITLTFGNHDAYILGSFKKACEIFSPWLKPDQKQEWANVFPFMRKRGNMAFISASSALATPFFCAAGYFGKTQAKHLSSLLDQAKDENLFRVVMIHHPPLYNAAHRHKELWGIARFQDVIKNSGAELILHGHTHLPTLNKIEGKNGLVPVVGVASASQAFGGRKPPANYNWFEVSRNANNWQCLMTRYTITDANNTIHALDKQQVFPLTS